MKNNRAITLMTLIIMVIILLILLGIGTKVIIDGKLISSAEKAVNGTNNKISEEQKEVDYLIGELTDIEQSRCTHEWKEQEILKEPTCAEQGQKKEICIKCEKEKISAIARLPHKFQKEKCTICDQKLIIGTYVRGYNPSIGENGETITTTYTSTGDQTAGTVETDGTLDGTKGNGYGDQTFTVKSIEKWRVTRQDSEGRIVITTADTIQTDENEQYYRRGQAGYMNIEELNKICSIYGQGKYADKTMYSVGNGTIAASGGKCIEGEDIKNNIVDKNAIGSSKTFIKKLDDSGKYNIYEVSDNDRENTLSPWTNCIYYDETNRIWKELQNDESITLNSYKFINPGITTDLQSKMIFCGSDNETHLSYWIDYNNIYLAWRYALYVICQVVDGKVDGITNLYSSIGATNTKSSNIRPIVYLKPSINLIYDDDTSEYIIAE